jgi:DNA-binding transcriptional LysR family regulator
MIKAMPATPNLDLDVLRSFATGVALGSFAQAAERLGRSTSAVSAQLKKLEAQTGTELLRKAGRGLELTEAGHTMLAYAQRLLELNDEAVAAVRSSQLEGLVRLGLPEDLGESVLPTVLGRFARAHPRLQVQVQSGRSAELAQAYEAGLLDLALLWELGRSAPPADGVELAQLPLCWIAPAGLDLTRESLPWWPVAAEVPESHNPVLPLVLLSKPCPLSALVPQVLGRAGVSWRSAFSSPSLTALWAAVSAGLGLAVRTRLGLPAHVRALAGDEAAALPALPSMQLYLLRRGSQAPVQQLAQLLAQSVQQRLKLDGCF